MRILKYIFLLLLLFLVGLTVFVITQKGEYNITKTKIIKTSRATVYNFVNDYRNWETFGSWVQDDKTMRFTYPQLTSGKGASYSWIGTDGNGSMKTISCKENESINQKMIYNDSPSEVFWTFKDTLGATKVSWRSKGKMSVMMKIKAFINGGADYVIGSMYEKSLANLDHTLDYELHTFSIKVNGIVYRPKDFYIDQSINSYESKVVKNLKIMIPKMQSFFEKNKMVMHGKPFIIYHSKNEVAKTVAFSVCMPIKDSVYIMPGSDVSSGKIEAMTAVKITLIGDYSHLKAAKTKAIDYILKNNLKQNFGIKDIEVYVKTIQDIKNPSKWITELYIPVYPKVVAAKPRVYIAKDSTATPAPTPVNPSSSTENP